MVAIESDFPLGAGLGGSSAASAALLTAIAEWNQNGMDRSSIAELGRTIEVEDLGIPGGRQDHYAAAFGGALALTFTDKTVVRRVRVSDDTLAGLSARSLLIYTGESRISGDTITAVLGAYEQRHKPVVRALARMKEIAREMASVLERGDLDALGEMLADHWIHQRSLHPSIPTARIDEIVARARAKRSPGSASCWTFPSMLAGPRCSPAPPYDHRP
jgi:D-glycero-alpha-D-manno-heptose-7-phosphate kinase